MPVCYQLPSPDFNNVTKVYRHLFTGPRTALSGASEANARPSKAMIYQRKSCDAPTIAYAAVQESRSEQIIVLTDKFSQTYFLLSSAKTWRPKIGNFDLQDLYSRILLLFEDNEDEWVKETLEWWNRYVVLESDRRDHCH